LKNCAVWEIPFMDLPRSRSPRRYNFFILYISYV